MSIFKRKKLCGFHECKNEATDVLCSSETMDYVVDVCEFHKNASCQRRAHKSESKRGVDAVCFMLESLTFRNFNLAKELFGDSSNLYYKNEKIYVFGSSYEEDEKVRNAYDEAEKKYREIILDIIIDDKLREIDEKENETLKESVVGPFNLTEDFIICNKPVREKEK
jgi:hypothetical protein